MEYSVEAQQEYVKRTFELRRQGQYRDLPEWYGDGKPRLSRMARQYRPLYTLMSTNRNYDGGPIPECHIRSWCKDHGWSIERTDDLIFIITGVDAAVLEWHRKNESDT